MRTLFVLLLLGLNAAADDRVLQGQAERQCAAITRALEAFLGPKLERAVPIQLVTEEELAAFARRQVEKQTPRGLLEVAQRLAERLHQVPRGYDLLENQIAMLERSVAGLYDADAHRLYVVEGKGRPGTGPFTITAAHELIHAYRAVDKDYWRRMLAVVDVDADWAQGVRFLVEGDATLLGYAVGLATLRNQPPGEILPTLRRHAADPDRSMAEQRANPDLSEFPPVLREMLIGAYVYGQAFAAEVLAHGGTDALAAAYDRPPRSTEQVLHPAKYLGPEVDEPTVFTGGDPTAALGDGWTLALSNVMGEFDVRIHFLALLGEGEARRASEGWDGARFHFCTQRGRPGFVGITSTWDSEQDAREFASAWAGWAGRRDAGEVTPRATGSDLTLQTREGLVVIRVAGRDVQVADGVPPDRVEAVLAALAAAPRAERTADANPLRTNAPAD
ncbi:MAG: hypothetical protein ACYTEZ_04310 [Planctomycetota bacterium]